MNFAKNAGGFAQARPPGRVFWRPSLREAGGVWQQSGVAGTRPALRFWGLNRPAILLVGFLGALKCGQNSSAVGVEALTGRADTLTCPT